MHGYLLPMTKRATIPFSFSIFFNIAPEKMEVDFEIPKENQNTEIPLHVSCNDKWKENQVRKSIPCYTNMIHRLINPSTIYQS